MSEQSWNEPVEGAEGEDWDPAISDRAWYESKQTGDRGWMVRRDGKEAIKLDRVGVDEIRPFHDSEWKPILNRRPLTKHAITLVAFAADRELLKALGEHQKSRTEWASLSQAQRRKWMLEGPKEPATRAELYKVIMEALGPLAE